MMKKNMRKSIVLCGILLCCGMAHAQENRHTDKFEQLDTKLRSPNSYRTASGAPGHEYWQNTADYVIDVELDDDNQSIAGKETITYTNNSPDVLSYLWLQLDQNMRAKDSHTYNTATNSIDHEMPAYRMSGLMGNDFDGGFKIASVKGMDGNALPYTINKTMMVVDMPAPLNKGQKFSFQIEWSYNINNRLTMGGRAGYEPFAEDGNIVYTIAQFFPRMCVYADYEGWQNKQFLGSGEFTLPFGNYKVSITVPEDHIMDATGVLQNADKVLTKEQRDLLKKAEKAKDPVIVVSQKEAEAKEKTKAKGKKTWVFAAENVRDFAFATSRKFIWDAMGVEIGGKTIMCHSLYPKEGNPLWEEFSTRVVAHTLEVYSKFTFDYPYPKAVSVHADRIGMEYPMICFNFGRPNKDGTYPDYIKYGMISVIIHEVGHNFFPMIVNSDERQWTWMDEGLNSFLQFLAEKEFQEEYPHRGGPPHQIVPYMKTEKALLSPIMTNSEQALSLGPNAYTKPATALNILRETVMGRELFDRAFKEYSRRWMFKHPTPEDFFRTMEDASAVDLDWFWKGWFYGVDNVDVSLSAVKHYKFTDDLEAARTNAGEEEGPDFFTGRLSEEQKANIKPETSFYEITLENIGGLVSPVILEFTYKDGSKEIHRIPAEIWRKNDQKVKKVFRTEQEVETVVLDPFLETADTDLENNFWPQSQMPSRFQMFKEKASGGN